MIFEPVWVKVLRPFVIGLLALFTGVPIYVMVMSALKPLGDVQGPFQWWPSEITLQPFVDIWVTIPLAHYFVNSAVVALSATLFSMIVAIFAAYAINRFTFPGRRLFISLVLSTQMFPGILFLLPLYLIFVNVSGVIGINLYGSQLGLIITYLTFSLPFSIWMLVGYFDSIPADLDEAACVDGCTPLGALFRVVLPSAMPGIVAVAVFAFMTAWGEVLFASVMTTSETRTLAVGLQEYATRSNVYWNQVMAASLVVSLPVVLGFLMLQRFLVQGLTSGAVK